MSVERLRMVVAGAGSLGCLYGAWAASAGVDVTLVASPRHAGVFERSGLTVIDLQGRSTQHQPVVARSLSDVQPCDVLLLATKAQDSHHALRDLNWQPRAAWSIQNGAGQAALLERYFGSAAVGCASMVGGTLQPDGTVRHTFGGSTYVGALQTSDPEAVRLVEVANGAEARIVHRVDIDAVMWSKAVLAVAAMGTSILLRVPYHQVFLNPSAASLFLDLLHEGVSVVRAVGSEPVDLPGPLQVATLVSASRGEALVVMKAVGDAMVASGQTAVRVSMLQSVESGRSLEHDAVFGYVIEIARANGVAVPKTEFVHHVARTLDHRAKPASRQDFERAR